MDNTHKYESGFSRERKHQRKNCSPKDDKEEYLKTLKFLDCIGNIDSNLVEKAEKSRDISKRSTLENETKIS